MKALLSILLLLSLLACVNKTVVNNRSTKNSGKFKIVKIDSVNNWYLIYAKKDHSMYKIVSQKSFVAIAAIKIKKKHSYFLELKSVMGNIHYGDHKFVGVVDCIRFDSITSICIERPKMLDLYTSQNLKGLYLSKD